MIQPPNQNIDKDWFLEHHIMMHRIRAFEETAARANQDKLVLGAIHLSIGQEAIASGVCKNLMKEDFLLSTHRGHGHTLAKGADPEQQPVSQGHTCISGFTRRIVASQQRTYTIRYADNDRASH